ncbi:type II toxin-antitoxin system RelE/ParE family toxin [Myxosarcina sp. GI1]|uniref:type II toxin-antitoxin system RelE/ParE family toxin n=1 Tax=Myxosarcina sp. GI1 TaxID=1541065 RepID=UPI00055AC9E7|nr:type II toxin-antitoxin system RelE/ParE family toxin [Myxosarcina sp. GI1]
MTRRIVITPRASRDIDELFEYIAQNNSDAALRFFDAARQTFSQLARTPGLGRAYEMSKPELKGLRRWKIKGFEKYIVFYRYSEDFLEIVRIIYAGRDLRSLLEDETDS